MLFDKKMLFKESISWIELGDKWRIECGMYRFSKDE